MAVFTDQQKIELLSDLVAIHSVNGNEVAVAQYLQKLLGQHDIQAELIPLSEGRTNLIAEIGQGSPVLGVSGHMDVVDPGDTTQWHSDPFKLTERNGRLYGRGANDMKSGLVALVVALIELHAAGQPQHGRIRLMATVGEEVGELGSAAFFDQGTMADVDALLIGEPTGYHIFYAHKGSMDIRLSSQGKAAHSSMPELGANAIDPLLAILNQANVAFRDSDRANELLGQLTFNTTVLHGGEQVNSIPATATAEMNVRTIPEFDNAAVIATLQNLVDQQNDQGAQVAMDVFMSQWPVEEPQDTPLSNLAASVGEPFAGEAIPKLALPAVTDASNLLKQKGHKFPFVVFGPGNESAHQIDEYVDRQMFLDFTTLYQKLFVAYLNREK
ncbi:succinyl-diaminopimelate desuccinylase [Levilactobacillus koreensis JCM 16448]|uniref:Probable succinyl-diaminopimelate desuccinylase n=1 Tax=Levilactobacillus koreensis TaxID=637971 RepID=A0AAC8UY27_9LACO|nr:ArgE/DapE family deacylase [Levilactobacillus koreensis]AKP65842.1 succinyl-diaminopimelate desuccinylase [Levilactobacillus koreensis]KRK87184.1 succinyl-diaminopimelate desuccinylase [Levilactobacillus koreensis JCM 16448]